MVNIKELSHQLSFMWSRRWTFKGYIASFIFLNVCLLPPMFAVSHFVLTKINIVSSPKTYGCFFTFVVFFYGILNLILVGMWAYWRTIPTSNDGKLTILFAPTSDSETSLLVCKMYRKLCDDLSARGLSNLIECKQLPENHTIRTAEDSHDILRRSGARLAIYGAFQKGKLNDEPIEGFRSIAFSVTHRQFNLNTLPAIAKHLAAALDARKFAVHEKNSFIEQDVVINNLSEVSRFFIGLALTLDLKINDAREILEPLLLDAERKAYSNANNPQLVKFAHSIRCCLAVIYEASFTHAYNTRLIDNISDRSFDDAAMECKGYLERLKKLKAVNSSYYLCEAILHFHFGDIAAAIKAVEHARRLTPFANASPHISLAFLYLWKGEYKKSFMQYVRAGKWASPDMTLIMNVLTFFSTIRRLHPARTEILFSQAFINDRFLDQRVALEDYNSFMAASGTKPSEFVSYAKRRINDLESVLKVTDGKNSYLPPMKIAQGSATFAVAFFITLLAAT